jgi:hypothetical protein
VREATLGNRSCTSAGRSTKIRTARTNVPPDSRTSSTALIRGPSAGFRQRTRVAALLALTHVKRQRRAFWHHCGNARCLGDMARPIRCRSSAFWRFRAEHRPREQGGGRGADPKSSAMAQIDGWTSAAGIFLAGRRRDLEVGRGQVSIVPRPRSNGRLRLNPRLINLENEATGARAISPDGAIRHAEDPRDRSSTLRLHVGGGREIPNRSALERRSSEPAACNPVKLNCAQPPQSSNRSPAIPRMRPRSRRLRAARDRWLFSPEPMAAPGTGWQCGGRAIRLTRCSRCAGGVRDTAHRERGRAEAVSRHKSPARVAL